MHICFVLTTPYALNAFVVPTVKTLLEKGWKVTVLVNTHSGLVSDAIVEGAEIIHLDIARQISPFSDIKALLSLIAVFNIRRFDMVHSITPKAGLLAMIAARLTRVEVRIHTFTGQVWVTRQGAMRWLLRSLDRVIARCATALLVDSPSQRDFLVAENIAPLDRLDVLGEGSITGVDTERFAPNEVLRQNVRDSLNISPETVVLLYVGRMHKDKGIAEIVRSFAVVAARYAHVRLLLVGPDEGALQEALEFAGEFRDRIHTEGLTQQPEIYMAASDVFCMASYREGFGLSIIEAGSCGMPSVAYRIYGVTDAIADGSTGYLVPLRDELAFAGAICKLIEAPEKRKKMGYAARQRAELIFSRHIVVQAWLRFYDQQTNRAKS